MIPILPSSVEGGVQEGLRPREVVGEGDAPEDDDEDDEEERKDDLGQVVEVLGHPERIVLLFLGSFNFIRPLLTRISLVRK